MNTKSRRWVIFLGLLLGVAGCGDGPDQILRDAKNVENESTDVLTQVTDDASGEWAAKVAAKKLKEKFTDLKERLDKYLKSADDSQKAALALMALGKHYNQDLMATFKRQEAELARVRRINFSDSQVKDTFNKWAEQTSGTKQAPQPMQSQGSDKKATPHKCESCGALTGIGGDGPLLTHCPNCGARLKGIASWVIVLAGAGVVAVGWLVTFLVKKQTAK